MRKFSIKSLKLPKRIMGLRSSSAIPFILLFIAVVFILYPVAMLITASFDDGSNVSFSGYAKVFSSPATYKALFNTFKMVLGVLAGTWVMGGFLAFVREKTDYKRKKLLDFCVFFSFTIPAYILSISWIEIVARGGYLHRILKAAFPNMSYNISGYSIGASSFVLALHLYPLVYYGVSNALKLLGDAPEQSARVCGAKKPRIIFSVIFPLVLPSFISTGLLVISRSMANFGVPAQLASTTGEAVLTTRVFAAMSDLNLSAVSVLSLVMIAISVFLFVLSERALKSRKFNTETSAKTNSKTKIELGKWSKPLNSSIIAFFIVTMVTPAVTIIISSFFKRWGLKFSLENLTFNNYVKLFSEENLLTRPLLNSLFFGIVAAVAAVFFASLTVYFYKYKHSRATKLLINIAQLPIAIPNMILAVAAMFAWINEPFKLYGTGAIIIVTYVVLFIPICIKQILGGVNNIDPSLDFAAQTVGIRLMKRFNRIFMPQIKNSLIAGFIICFLISLKEIPISLLLYTTDTKTLGVMLFTIQSNSYGLEMTSTVSVVVIALSITGNIILRKFSSKGYNQYG